VIPEDGKDREEKKRAERRGRSNEEKLDGFGRK
jgi:hypothetical protein